MMTQAFYTGLSGLRTNQIAIDAVSDNLANTSTVGYRGYNVEFSSLFEENLNTQNNASSVNSSIGVGSQVNGTVLNEKNGSLNLSDRNTDLAIDGDGWFGVQASDKPIYTRDGAFTFDANSDLVTNDGFHVLGTMANNISNGVLTTQLAETTLGDVGTQKKLSFPDSLTFPPVPTTTATFLANLGTADEIRGVGAGIVDGQGNKNNLNLKFYNQNVDMELIINGTTQVVTTNKWYTQDNGKTAIRAVDLRVGMNVAEFDRKTGAVGSSVKINTLDNKILQNSNTSSGLAWDVVATTQTLDGETIYDTQFGSVKFDSAGALLSTTLSSIDNNGSNINIDLGTGYKGITAMNSPITLSSSADGLQGGELVGYEINVNAEVIATFTNGQQSSVGKVALFHFQNNQGLERINGSRFRESNNSGEPIFYKNAAGKNIAGATLQNFKLESSNVKLEAGLTDLIIHQRAYDANSKSITTADQMIQKALSMDA